MRETTALLLLLSLAGCGTPPGPPPEPARRELNLAPGTAWIYVDEKAVEYTTRVEGPHSLDGVACIKIRGVSVGASETRWDSQDVSYWSLKDGIPVLHGVGEDDRVLIARQPALLYRRDAERGIAWDGRFVSRKDPKTGLEESANCKFIAGGVEDVATGAGAFRAYHVVQEWTHKGKVWVRDESWWADGVGVVRQVFRVYKNDVPIRTLQLNLKVFLQAQPVKNP